MGSGSPVAREGAERTASAASTTIAAPPRGLQGRRSVDEQAVSRRAPRQGGWDRRPRRPGAAQAIALALGGDRGAPGRRPSPGASPETGGGRRWVDGRGRHCSPRIAAPAPLPPTAIPPRGAAGPSRPGGCRRAAAARRSRCRRGTGRSRLQEVETGPPAVALGAAPRPIRAESRRRRRPSARHRRTPRASRGERSRSPARRQGEDTSWRPASRRLVKARRSSRSARRSREPRWRPAIRVRGVSRFLVQVPNPYPGSRRRCRGGSRVPYSTCYYAKGGTGKLSGPSEVFPGPAA